MDKLCSPMFGICGKRQKIGEEQLKLEERNEEIEEELRNAQKVDGRTIKLLVLGAGESGKSTIIKQMKLLHNMMNKMDCELFKRIIYANIITSMGNILLAMKPLGFEFDSLFRKADMEIVLDVLDNDEVFEVMDVEVTIAISNLWQDDGVKKCFEQRYKYQLNDCAKYFLDNLHRIALHFYEPTIQDMLYARAQTTGIVEIGFDVDEVKFRVFDVGGQRTERRKWIHFFDDVKAVIFVAAISEYNQTMREDPEANRLLDSVALFDYVCNNKCFEQSSMILFLNKIDLFREKIGNNQAITEAFPDYEGNHDYNECFNFIMEKFKGRKKNGAGGIYIHETCATDSDQVHRVLLAVQHMILRENLKKSGLLT